MCGKEKLGQKKLRGSSLAFQVRHSLHGETMVSYIAQGVDGSKVYWGNISILQDGLHP